MQNVFSLNILAHKDGLLLDFCFRVSIFYIITCIDLPNIFGYFGVYFFECLLLIFFEINHVDDYIRRQLRKNVAEIVNFLPFDHADSLVIDFFPLHILLA